MGARRHLVFLSAFALLTAAPAARGQEPNPDITGTWNLQMTVLLEGEEQPCVYVGTVEATQGEGSSWQGPAELALVTGPAACAAEMIGDLTGELDTEGGVTTITGFIDGGQPDGNADFMGTITPNPGGSGSFAVTQGPFEDEEGEWLAQLQQSLLEIPALMPAGLAVLTLLLLAGGAWLLSRQVSA
jgi:hypothetical protein